MAQQELDQVQQGDGIRHSPKKNRELKSLPPRKRILICGAGNREIYHCKGVGMLVYQNDGVTLFSPKRDSKLRNSTGGLHNLVKVFKVPNPWMEEPGRLQSMGR